MNWLGGVRRDIGPELARQVEGKLEEMLPKLQMLADVVRRDSTWRKRTKGVGVLTKRQAMDWCVVGPVARASGLSDDVRLSGNAGYALQGIRFKPVWREEGDTWARSMVRMDEVLQSVELVHQCLALLPEGPIDRQFKGNPEGEGFSRNEAPRGELMYWVKARGEARLDRVSVRTPAFVNIPPLTEMLPGCEFPDVPVIVVSVDPCICCTDR